MVIGGECLVYGLIDTEADADSKRPKSHHNN